MLLAFNAALAEPSSAPPATEPVRVSIDWQGHPAMHLTWRFFAPGLTDAEPRLSWRHRFSQVATRPALEASGVRLFLMAAMAAERARNPRHARDLVNRELDYVEAFVRDHPDGWALAKTPEEARALLRDTDKRVVVHAIEGGHDLFTSPADAAYWADRGVALVTLMHLRDDELGGAAILPMAIGPLINPAGARNVREGVRRGLTERGAQAMVELDRAGVLVDMSHMAPETIDDAIGVARTFGFAPVVTHGKLERLHHSEFGFREDQVLDVYRLGGVFSLGLSPQMLDPVDPADEVPLDVCRSTVEMFTYHYEAVRALVQAHADELLGRPIARTADGGLDPADADAMARLSIGWSSDWNGWVHHAAPVYGRCRPRSERPTPLSAYDVHGMRDPSDLPGHWAAMDQLGADRTPMDWSAERFLALWAEARAGSPTQSASARSTP